MKDILEKYFIENGLDWNEDIYKKFESYKNLLVEWNKKFNLTAITDEKAIAVKHFIDSISIIKNIAGAKSLVDIGAGAGFPGLPLKIAGYDGELVLMDSTEKKVGFLKAVIDELGLERCSAVHIRAEDAGRGKYREKFDAAAARAVAALPVLSEYCLPLVKKGGIFIAMKGPDAVAEVKGSEEAIKKLGGKINTVKKFTLGDTDNERSLIIIKKANHTPAIYPRKAGTPKKKPL